MGSAFEKFDKQEELKQRLRSLPRFFLDPLRRYSRQEKASAESLDGAWIARKSDGSLHRVRFAHRDDAKRLLLAEYEALSKASHEYLLKLMWAGVHNHCLYLATSWIDAEERKEWPIPIRTLLKQVECAARGVAALHSAGLVHGDLKPETILWHGDRAVVSDLKLSAPAGRREDASYSPKFAAPEQILKEAVGPEADVYALGVTLYTLFVRDRFPVLLEAQEDDGASRKTGSLSPVTTFPETGQVASDGKIVGVKILFRNGLSRLVDGAADAARISSTLAIVRRACDLDPGKRYSNAGALADALGEALSI
jgi:serine/threonine protein kinase